MTTKKLLSLVCIAAIAASWLPLTNLSAQDAEIPPVPAPTPGSPAIEKGPAAQITMDDGTGVSFQLRGRHARRVLLRAGQRTTVILQYDPSYAGLLLEVAALDGGNIGFPGDRNFVASNGMVVLQFSDAQEPGLYRLAVNCGGTASTLEFWVPDPDGSGVDASVLVPTAAVSASNP
jgi:hypothetical protein